MPRLVPQKTPREGAIQLGDLPEFKAIRERLEAAPPEREIIQPDPNTARPRPSPTRNGTEHQGFADMVRGPAKRDASDPRNIYSGETIRIDRMPDQVNGDTYHLETTKPLPRYKQSMAIAAGFDPVGDADSALAWQASMEAHHGTGKDLNKLAIALDDKAQRMER